MEHYADITGLLYKLMRSELTQEESAVLNDWIAASEQNRQFVAQIKNTQAFMADVRAAEEAEEIDVDAAWNRLQEHALEKPVSRQLMPASPMKRYVTVAAAVIGLAILIPFSLIWFVHHTPANLQEVDTSLSTDVTPGTNKAFLTLDDGSKILLDSLNNGALAQQGSVQIDKTDGQLHYASWKESGTDAVLYNKITVPNGGDVVPLELEDGSKVWLNAGSSISYPVSFNKGERKVEVTGEAYFEVASSLGEKEAPFVVRKDDLVVTVLGTNFNLNTYNNEDYIKVTLLDGSANLQYRQSSKTIQAGEQAILKNSAISVTNNVDIEQVVAWKNGTFQFNHTNIQPIMRQLERWYDLAPTRYESEAGKQLDFDGAISRYNNVSDVLNMLEKTRVVQFVMKGKQITVKKQ